MDFSRPKIRQAARRCAAVCALVVLASFAAGGRVEAAEDARQRPISLNVDSYEVDFRSGKTLMRNVTVSQGDVSISADRAEATGLEFENSHWSFQGNVHIRVEQQGDMRSDVATVDFRNKRIARATITGKPAHFEQQLEHSAQLARGHAGEIVYEVGDGTVRLSDDAWLTDGRNEISGPRLVYNIRDERVEAATEPGQDQRVRITINPDARAQPESRQ